LRHLLDAWEEQPQKLERSIEAGAMRAFGLNNAT
jgi:hypothetical protein